MASQFKRLILAATVLCLSACATLGPSEEEWARADFGAPIQQEEAEDMVKYYFDQRVEDPNSTQITYGDVKKDWMQHPLVNDGATTFGYTMEVKVNTRNSLGRFTGDEGFKFMFRNRQIYHIVAQPRLSNDVTYMGKIY